MGKRLITQRRGKGTPRYRSPSHRFKGEITYPRFKEQGKIGGQVMNIIDDPARSAPVAEVLLENFNRIKMIASEGIKVGQWIEIGDDAKVEDGNILPLEKIKEGTKVYNIELRPGDGGKLVRSSGISAYVVSHEKDAGVTYLQLPSKKTMAINSRARATVGKVAGGGRKDKPMVHAGQAYHAHHVKGKLYPTVSGSAMNAVDHPHGGAHSNVGKPTTVSHNTPPGRKVGHIAARRTGRKKR